MGLLTAMLCRAQTPAINAGGIVGAGLSSPPVTAVSPGAIVSVFGQNFAPSGGGNDAPANAALPTTLGGVCVQFGSVNAPILVVRPNQINIQVPDVPVGSVPVQVVVNCGTGQDIASNSVTVQVQSTSPEFFYFASSPGAYPVVAYNPSTGVLVGAPGLISGRDFAPAAPGSIVTLFGTGLGAVQPSVAPGQIAVSAAQVTQPVSVAIAGITVPATDLIYAGVAPNFAGVYQINARVPLAATSGPQPVTVTVGGVTSPPGYIEVTTANLYTSSSGISTTCGNNPATDDSSTLHNQLAQNGYVVLPANQICYANLIGDNSIPSNSVITGIPGRSILRPFALGQPIISTYGNGPSSTIDNITIEGITFDGMGANLANARTGLVSFQYVTNLRFVNNVIQSSGPNLQGEALLLTDSGGYIADNDISNFGTQVDIFQDGFGQLPPNAVTSLVRNRIHDNTSQGGDGVYVHGPDHGPPLDMPVTVEGNYVSNTQFHQGDIGQTGNAFGVYEAQKVRFLDNIAISPTYSCYRSAFANQIIFTGNHCENSGDVALYSEFSSERNSWMNNYVNGAAYSCMQLTNFTTDPPGQEHTAIGNHLLNCGAWGIEAEGDVVLTGNLIDHTSAAAIQIGYGPQAQFVIVKNNIILDSNPTRPGATPVGICVEHGPQDLGHVVESNLIDLAVPQIVACDHGSVYQGGALQPGLTIRNQSVPMALLGAPDDGSEVFVPDAAPQGNCTAPGAGAFARRAAGAWVCH